MLTRKTLESVGELKEKLALEIQGIVDGFLQDTGLHLTIFVKGEVCEDGQLLRDIDVDVRFP